jgi:hypothetical protein
LAKAQAFWRWFEKHQDVLHSFDGGDARVRDRIFKKLSKQLRKVNPDLTFEFSPVFEDGTREFVISAGGIREAFPAVEGLYSASPDLPGWRFIKFRPRRTPIFTVQVGGLTLDPETVHFALFRDGIKLGIMLFHSGYRPELKTEYDHACYLLLDEALGEYVVETAVGFIEIHHSDHEFFDGAQTLPDLPTTFDEAFERFCSDETDDWA